MDVSGWRNTMARHAAELSVTGCWDLKLWIVPSPRITRHLAGRTAIDSMKGVLARMSTSRFSTTIRSKVNSWSSQVTDKRVSPTTRRRDEAFAWWTD